jgi:hypothetical protein
MRSNLPIGSTSAMPPKGDWFARLAVATSPNFRSSGDLFAGRGDCAALGDQTS